MKRFLSILICILILLTVSACGNETYSLSVEIDAMPTNIDPQLAVSDTELMIVRNTFEGLMRTDRAGEIKPALAKSYTVSNDKKTYTFKLRDEIFWSNGTPLNAEDFVFALRRASNPETASPHADLLRNIKGVPSALKGKTDYSNIGVQAIDQKTLVISLQNADSLFLEKLTKSVYMPCNEEFFLSCKGKYGLSMEDMIFCGTYSVGQWNSEGNSVKLIVNDKYNGNFPIGPNRIWLQLPKENDKQSRTERVSSEIIDIAKLGIEDTSKSDLDGIKTTNIYNASYSIVFNTDTVVGKNGKMLRSFATSIDRDSLKNVIPDSFNPTSSIIPNVCKVDKESAEQVFKNNNKFVYSPKKSRDLFLESLKIYPDGKFPTFSILCEDNEIIKNVLANSVSFWQQNLGAYISIETVPAEELQQRVLNGEYTAAFVSVTAKNEETYDFLSSFKTGYSQNIINFSSKKFDNVINEKNRNNKKQLILAERIILDSASIIPIFQSPTIFATPENIKGAQFSIYNGTADFSFIYREN